MIFKIKIAPFFLIPLICLWFNNAKAQTAPAVTRAEYFFDTDPGAGNGTPLQALSGQFGSTIQSIGGNPSVSGLTTGLHTLNVRTLGSSGNWSPVFTTVFNIDACSPMPTATVMPGTQQSICTNDTIPLTATATGTGITYQWRLNGVNIPGATSAIYKVTTAGIYDVAVLNDNGCGAGSNQDTILTNNTLVTPALAISATNNSICSGTSVTFSASSVYGGSSPAYQWYLNGNAVGGDSATYTATTLSNSAHVYCVMTSNAACVATPTATSNIDTVVVNAIPAAGITGTAAGCGTVSLTATGGTGYAWSGGNSTNTATNTFTSSNTYIVTVTGAGGCSATASQSVTVNPAITASITGTTTGCDTVSLTATGGTSYAWSGGSSTNTATNTFTGSNTYIVTVTGTGGCSATASQSVTVNPVITAGITGTATGCGTVTLTAIGGTSYAWSGGGSTNTATNTFTSSNTYIVTVTGTGGCSATASQSITVNPAITAGITGTATGCGSVSLTAIGGGTYAWNGGNSTNTAANTFSSSNTYIVTVTGAGGCSATASASVTVNANVTAGITGTTNGCGSVSLTATGGTGYAWSGGNSTNTAANTFTSSNTYIVTVTGTGGCSATASQNVTVNPSVNAGITGTTTACVSVTLTATGGTSYAWSGGGSPNTASNTFTSSDTYIVTVTGMGGCSATASQSVTVNTLPVPAINGTATGCGTVTLTATGGSTYAWSGGNSTHTAIDTFSSSNTYTVTVTAANQCSATASQAVTVHTLPTANITPNGPTTFCTGDSVILSANTESSYLWSNSALTQTVTVKQTGNYTVKVTDANGCTATSTLVSVTANSSITPTIQITATPSGAICAGNSITFHTTVNGQGNAPTYKWYVDGINTGITTDTVSTNQLQNNNAVTCVLTSSAGCANPDTALSNAITVTVNPVVTPAISIAATLTDVCTGSADTIAATVTNGGNAPVYIWLLNNQPVNNSGNSYISDSLLSSDVVKCVLISSAVCAQPDTVTSSGTSVTVNPAPNATITPSGTVAVCSGDSVQLSAPAGNTAYVWSTHATLQSIYVQFAGNYTVTVSNVNNCTAVSAPVTVVVNPLPATPVITQSGDSLTSSVASGYQWYLNDTAIGNATGRTWVAARTGNYTVQITDSNGCSNASTVLDVTTLGISDITEAYGVKLYPNPNTGNFVLEFTDNIVRDVEITDAIGRTVMADTKVSRQQNFNVEELSAGVYIVRINQHGQIQSLKFSVIK